MSVVGKGRLEAFSDGVIAILITIMVLELTVPAGPHFTDLAQELPKFIGYIISYFYLGIYWVNHHRLLHDIKVVSQRALWCNLVLLFFMSLIPFATSWVTTQGYAAEPTLFYCLVLLAVALVYQAFVVAVSCEDSILATMLHNMTHNKLAIFSVWGLVVACLTALLAPWTSLVLVVLTVAPWTILTQKQYVA